VVPVSPDKKDLSDSLFYMWRCVIAIAHADGSIPQQERNYLDTVIGNLERIYGLTPEQDKILDADLREPQNVSSLLPHVTAPEDRASLIYFGDLVAHADGIVTPNEHDILQKLHDDQMKTIDVEKLRKEIESDLAANRKDRAQELAQIHKTEQKKHPVFAALDRLMLRFGVDMLD
jgi:uncharacterized membrane protein YebE (DUF533 family)